MNFLEKIKHYNNPPGEGVFTVHAAREIKESYHQSLYKHSNPDKVRSSWLSSLKEVSLTDKPLLLGIPSDVGGGIQRGANWGPLFIRSRDQSLNQKVIDLGDIKTIPHFLHDKYLNQEIIEHCQNIHYQGEKLRVSPLSIAQDLTSSLFNYKRDCKLISLGGDHSISYPIVKEWIEFKRKNNIKVAIIHFDAHTDLMDERLGVDICFASWARHIINSLNKPSDLIQFGIRSSAKSKDYWTKSLGVQQYWNYDFKNLGIDKIIKEVGRYLSEENIDELYCSFDIDFLDAKYASSTGTPEVNGLAPHEAILIINALSSQSRLTGADLVEVAPFVKSHLSTALNPEPETTLLSAKIILNSFIENMTKN